MAVRTRTLRSLELRWFLPGAAPLDADGIFRRVAKRPEPREEERTDLYFASADEAVGFKLRSGRVELKSRQSRTPIRVAGQLGGFMETWAKWSWSAGGGLPEVQGDGRWVEVFKHRRQWFYGFDGQRLRLGEESEEVRGAMEITDLRVQGIASWTFAVEALEGDVELATQGLLQSAELLWSRLEIGPVSPDDSMGYPQWLARPDADAARSSR